MTKAKGILIVDGDKNSRMALVRALENEFHVESTTTGEEALLILGAAAMDLVFLGLELPGMSGIEVLRRARESWPSVHVVVITAHGTVDSAVDAMKRGAADFVQKPFTPEEIRAVTRSVLFPSPKDAQTVSYAHSVVQARRSISQNKLATAIAHIRKAVGLDPTRPEAFNLLGVASHLSGQRYKAQAYFRAAIALDPTYRPARENLERSVAGGARGLHMELCLGVAGEDSK